MLIMVKEYISGRGCCVLECSWILLIEIFDYDFGLKIVKGRFKFVFFEIWCIGGGV